MSRNTHRQDRRDFLRNLQYVLAGGTIAAVMPQFELVGSALAQSAPANDYRALVCIFLFGGNDSFNLLVPHESSAYDVYARSRGGVYDASSNNQGLAIARDRLLQVGDTAGKTWGLHPSCTALKTLFDQGELAFMANVGTLVQPITKAEYVAKARRVPDNLFSHNDQQRLWMRGESERASANMGWGGTMGERLASTNSAGFTALPPTVSLDGNNLFQTGTSSVPFCMASSGPVAFRNFESSSTAGTIRREALAALVGRKYTPLMQDQHAVIGESSMLLSSKMREVLDSANGGDIATVFPANNSLAAQLRMIARTIKASRSSAINHRRQIYFASMGGFDTHDNQMAIQPQLLSGLSEALGAFRTALVEIGAFNNVVSFTMSDFGRTLNSNGNGTDHAWGGVQLMMGGPVASGGPLNGRRVFGNYPLLELDGDQAVDRGRMIPTTSTNQFGATFARWMGVASGDLPTIFPGLGNFATPTLDFLA
ncbi:MAG: DUF1501 domain-containing protein [Pseudoxanthomonas sp.]